MLVSWRGNASFRAMKDAVGSFLTIQDEKVEPTLVTWGGTTRVATDADSMGRFLSEVAHRSGANVFALSAHVLTGGTILPWAISSPGATQSSAAREVGSAIGTATRGVTSAAGEFAGSIGSAAAGGAAAGLGIPGWVIGVAVAALAVLVVAIAALSVKKALK